MAKTNPFEFLQQVRAETAKVTWPTRNETVVTTIMVLIMAVLASIFFLLADTVLGWGVGLLLGLGR
jgi:preprotein translocase subunit SecE